MNECSDFPLGTFESEVLQRSCEREQKEQDGSFSPLADCPGSRCNREHQKVDVNTAFAEFRDGFSGRKPTACQIGERVQNHRGRAVGNKVPGGREQGA
jgi:hypothetical protein